MSADKIMKIGISCVNICHFQATELDSMQSFSVVLGSIANLAAVNAELRAYFFVMLATSRIIVCFTGEHIQNWMN